MDPRAHEALEALKQATATHNARHGTSTDVSSWAKPPHVVDVAQDVSSKEIVAPGKRRLARSEWHVAHGIRGERWCSNVADSTL